MQNEIIEAVSTLLNGTSLISLDSFAAKRNLHESVKSVLFRKKPHIHDKSDLGFSENNDSVRAIISKELNT